MKKKAHARFDKFMQAARDAACEAAEAMDRADLKEWTEFQDHAEALRNSAKMIATRTPAKAKRKKASPKGKSGRVGKRERA
jgi:hypothetical protein